MNSLLFTATDAAAPMVERLLSKVGTQWLVPADHNTLTLAAKDLDGIESDSFDYSFTNFGFLFFKDPNKAAKHVCRTLKPRGQAFITSWKDFGYMEAIEKAAVQVRPDHPSPYLPFDKAWLDSSYIKADFEQAGFRSVEVHQQPSSYASGSAPALSRSLVGMMEGMLKCRDGRIARCRAFLQSSSAPSKARLMYW